LRNKKVIARKVFLMFKRLQGFIIGFFVCALMIGVMPIKAAIEEYICYKADYKVVVNGAEYANPDLPILNYKGNTYAPFASILKTAGLNVTWNADLKQAEVTTPITQEELTMSESTTPLAEYSAALPEIKPDISLLPAGATFTTYRECDTAVLYNGETYLSKDDLATKFGVYYKSIDLKAGTVTYTNKTQDVVIVLDKNETNYFYDKKGLGYFNVKLFAGMLGD
jgi:hypothetical protein